MCKWRIESKHECIISIWGFPEILPFAWFCFANMLRYGISSVLWAPFSLKTILEESTPAGARQVRKTVEKAGKFLSIKRSRKQRDRCWPLGLGAKILLCAQSETSIRISRGTFSG